MRILLITLALIAAMPAAAQRGAALEQDGPEAAPQSMPVQPYRAGQVADSAVGQAGQRQTREQAAPNIEPTRRIASRIQNRVQSRIRNRIDRHYDPQANAASPFEIAGEQSQGAVGPNRR